jgi:hypothetical protein
MRPASTFAIAVCLLAALTLHPVASFGQRLPPQTTIAPAFRGAVPTPGTPGSPAPEIMLSQPSTWGGLLTPHTIVHAAGALIGIVAFNLYVAPLIAASAGGVAVTPSLVDPRVVATTLAAAGAVLTGYVYDRWTGQPIDRAYMWSRGGFVVGVAAGSEMLAVVGYPSSAAVPQFSPPGLANRVFLVSTGLVGAWLTNLWVNQGQAKHTP